MNIFSNDNLKEWLQNLQLRDIILQATNQVRFAETTCNLKPQGIDPDGQVAWDLHVQRTVELFSPIERVNLTFTVTKDVVNFE